MSPAERRCVRHMRDLLDAYERNPQPTIASALARTAAELDELAPTMYERRAHEQSERASAALDALMRESHE